MQIETGMASLGAESIPLVTDRSRKVHSAFGVSAAMAQGGFNKLGHWSLTEPHKGDKYLYQNRTGTSSIRVFRSRLKIWVVYFYGSHLGTERMLFRAGVSMVPKGEGRGGRDVIHCVTQRVTMCAASPLLPSAEHRRQHTLIMIEK
jgi:hypothetical protein